MDRLEEARRLLAGYYRLEDPTRFDPQSCEQRVEVELADGTLLRGFVDRIDGDPSSVVGIGLPTVRELLAAVGVDVTDLWRHGPDAQ